ncbi:hypothetical protein HOM50_02775 [bacterium]|jgi:hypothetical protein|nr:hypothetical protein [bacterium]MBT5015302.1 hypothetical protein [bacterium]
MKKVFILAAFSISLVGSVIGMVGDDQVKEGRRVTFADDIEEVQLIDRINYGEDFFFEADFKIVLRQLEDIIAIWADQLENREPIEDESTKAANKLLNKLSNLFLEPPLSTVSRNTVNLFYSYVSAFRDAILSFVSFVDIYNQRLKIDPFLLRAFRSVVANEKRVRRNWKLISRRQVVNPFAKRWAFSASLQKSWSKGCIERYS